MAISKIGNARQSSFINNSITLCITSTLTAGTVLLTQITITRELTKDDDPISLKAEPEVDATFMEVSGMLEMGESIWLHEHDTEADN